MVGAKIGSRGKTPGGIGPNRLAGVRSRPWSGSYYPVFDSGRGRDQKKLAGQRPRPEPGSEFFGRGQTLTGVGDKNISRRQAPAGVGVTKNCWNQSRPLEDTAK